MMANLSGFNLFIHLLNPLHISCYLVKYLPFVSYESLWDKPLLSLPSECCMHFDKVLVSCIFKACLVSLNIRVTSDPWTPVGKLSKQWACTCVNDYLIRRANNTTPRYIGQCDAHWSISPYLQIVEVCTHTTTCKLYQVWARVNNKKCHNTFYIDSMPSHTICKEINMRQFFYSQLPEYNEVKVNSINHHNSMNFF